MHSSSLTQSSRLLRSPSGPPPPLNGTNEQLSSASIFEHVDRMSRGADASRRLPSKVQLIAMQPMPLPPLHGTPITDKLSDANQINREVVIFNRVLMPNSQERENEMPKQRMATPLTSVSSLQIQVALRHKSEIEHHRNKIRLRAKRKGHYDFPAMDDVACGLANGKDEDQIYQKAQGDKIDDPEAQMPMSIFTGSKKRSGQERMCGVTAEEQRTL